MQKVVYAIFEAQTIGTESLNCDIRHSLVKDDRKM